MTTAPSSPLPAGAPRHVTMVIQRFRPAFSGQGVQVEELCRALWQRGVRSTIVAAAPAGDGDDHERQPGYEIVRLAASPAGQRARRHGWTVRFARRALGYLWRHAASTDLLHVHGLTDALYASWLVGRARRLPVLMEMTLLGDDDPEAVRDSRLRLARLRYALYRRCDGYVAMSGAFLPAYHGCGMPEDRLRVIPQGVDVERFRPATPAERDAARDEFGLPRGAEVVAFVGSLVGRKGVDVLLEAWKRLAALRPEAHLLLTGPDRFDAHEANAALAGWLADLPAAAAARVHRTGRLDDTAPALRAADVFAFPSRREGFGSVIIEAMASGLPAVVAHLPGITDLIFGPDPSACGGVIVDQDDAAMLGDSLCGLLEAAERRQSMGEAARLRAVEGFGFDTVARQYLDWYAELRRRRGLAR